MLHMNPKDRISAIGAGIFKQYWDKSTHHAIIVE